MRSKIEYLANLVRALDKTSSNSHIQNIESVLRDIRNSAGIPFYLVPFLYYVLKNLNNKLEDTANSECRNIVKNIEKKVTGTNGNATAGKIATNGQIQMNKDIHSVNAAYKMFGSFGFTLWR